MICPLCLGEGGHENGVDWCPECDGTGALAEEDGELPSVDCAACMGTGEGYAGLRCSDCRGTGLDRMAIERLYEAGMEDA